jgi:hypothetical protein
VGGGIRRFHVGPFAGPRLSTIVEHHSTHMRTLTAIALLVLFSHAAVVQADEPLVRPARYEVASPSGKYVAILDPKTGVVVRTAGATNVLWSGTNWFRVAFLADDGQHLVTGYDGMNLIPRNYTKDLVLVTFWRRDKKIRDVTVGELFPDTRILKQTVSSYYWGSIKGITNSTLIVNRCDGQVVGFRVSTGNIAK